MDEHSIPIDIHTTKLLDWLVSRRHVNKDWQNNILKIREKINNAIRDMPAHEEIVKLLSGQHINYFHCLKIVEILKETEADTKNLFGRYGSQRMKDWQDILNLYQRDNLYLAEAAQVMIRNVSFEVPSLKKQVAKLEQTEAECEKKIKDYSKAETAALNEFNVACKQLGIKGEKIKKEVVQLLDELPEIYEKATESIKFVENGIRLYLSFVTYHGGEEGLVLPLLRFLVNNGNTTTYEYTYGEKPVVIEVPPLNITDDEDKEANLDDQIDFGADIDYGAIDFGDSPNSEAEIDWGNLKNDEGFEIVDHVDLNISLEESGIVVENAGLDGGVARGNDALTILDNPALRDQVLNDLLELEAFLKMRLFEMSGDADLLTVSQMQNAPTFLQMQTLETVASMGDAVHIALNSLLNKRTQHLHNIKHSLRYVDMLAANLQQKLTVVERMKANKKVLDGKIVDLRQEVRNIQPVINGIINNTKKLQKEIESDISKKYKGRIVNIVGGVAML